MPHTAFPDGQGHVWFTEYGAGKIGRVDVKTGTIEEFKAPSAVPPSPHGITIDRFGFVWYTEQTSGQIGRFDPKTNTFKQYRVPGPHNRTWKPREIVSPGDGPHTLIPDDQGKIWFTIAGSSNLRRLDPDTGDVKEYFIREEGHGGLYGVTRDPKNGRIWYAGLGFNEVGYVDPASGKVTRFSMLTPNAGPRRCHVDAQSVLWCDLYNVSKIARIDPATGKVSEWDLPGQRDGKPYPSGVDAKGRFWTQSATDDLLYMFDPKTEKFTRYQMPNNGNGLRDFYIDERGWMWAAVWGHNQVIGFTLDEK